MHGRGPQRLVEGRAEARVQEQAEACVAAWAEERADRCVAAWVEAVRVWAKAWQADCCHCSMTSKRPTRITIEKKWEK